MCVEEDFRASLAIVSGGLFLQVSTSNIHTKNIPVLFSLDLCT